MKRWHVGVLVAMVSVWGCEAKKAEKAPEKAAAEEAPDERADGYTEAMAREHASDKPDPNAASETAPAAEVQGASVVYGELEGVELTGYLAQPKDATGPLPTLIVIHEWWGLNANIEAMAKRLAGEGYMALAVDLYEGKTADKPEDAKALMMAAMGNPERGKANLALARDFLRSKQAESKMGVIGWCFGGAWSLNASLAMPEALDATVIYYGRLVTEPEKLAPLDMPILGLFGSEDQGIPVDQVKAFESALESSGKKADIHIYEGAGHAFANPSGHNYQAKAAEDAWGKTTAFLAQHLKK